MSDNQLVIHRDSVSKYAFFAKGREESIPEITDAMLMAEERLQTEQRLSEMFFGSAGGSMEDLYELYRPKLEELQAEIPTQVLKEEDLKTEVADPFHAKKYEESKVIFARREVKETDPFDPAYSQSAIPPGSRSTEYVQDNRNIGTRPAYTDRAAGPTQTYDPVARPTTTPTNRPPHIYDQIPRVMQNVQNVAMTTPKFEPDRSGQGWGKYAHKTRWQKIKEWFHSKNARITMKVGLLMALQLGMAVVGKKYSFDGLWQGGMFLSMMMGVFVITKELQKDGFDARGFGI